MFWMFAKSQINFTLFYSPNKTHKINKMQHVEQNDTYSQEQKLQERKPKIRPLNLSVQQLKQRLITLKNYNIWKKTKAKRINYKELNADQSSPIIHTAASYGCRYGYNEVFAEFIKNQLEKQQKKQDGRHNCQSQERNQHQSNSITKDKPSFINYKTQDKEKEKIYKMINQTPHKNGKEIIIKKRRSSTQPKLINQSTIKRRALPYPKQLASLKKKLKILPSLLKRVKTQPTDINPQEENPTLSLVSNSPQQSQAIKPQILQKSISSFQAQHPFQQNYHNRSAYLKNIHSILNKSTQLLHGHSNNSSIESDYIRVSNSSYNSAVCKSKKSQSQILRPQHSKRYLSYWPKYTKYGISDSDNTKFQQILKRCSQINSQGMSQNEDLNQMISIIKEQISIQQNQINQEVLQEEKNAFQHKFDYKINLQREKYKRNMKELLRCKKEYRIEKQREEIRANGIKRMKKMGDMDIRIQKNAMKMEEKEED